MPSNGQGTKFKLSADVVLRVAAVENVKFSEDFCERVLEAAREIVVRYNKLKVLKIEYAPECLTLYVTCLNPYDGLAGFTTDFRQRVQTLTMFGKDADILEHLFDRYPDLRKHPQVGELVGAFNNMCGKADELRGTLGSPSVEARRMDLELAGVEDPATLASPKPKQPGLDKEGRLAMRDLALYGKAPGQVPKTAAESLVQPGSDIVKPPEESE